MAVVVIVCGSGLAFESLLACMILITPMSMDSGDVNKLRKFEHHY